MTAAARARSRRPLIVAALAVIAPGCTTSAPQLLGAQPSWRQGGPVAPAPPVVTRRFAPAGAPARSYNAPLEAPPAGPLEASVIEAVRDVATRGKLASPVADARLFRACAELAAIAPESSFVDYPFVEFALQRNGIIEPAPHVYVLWGPLDPVSVVDKLKPDLAGLLGDGRPSRFGIGAVSRKPDGTGAIVFILQETPVALAELPRELPAGGSVVLDAVLDDHYQRPELFVLREDGRSEPLPIGEPRPSGFRTRFACGGHRGRQLLEILGRDRRGPITLAKFPVWCGTRAPDELTEATYDEPPVSTPEAAEREVLAAVNRERTAAGLVALRWNAQTAEVARAHSSEMQRRHEIGHVSPTTGDTLDRIRAASIRTPVVYENVARGYGVRQLHHGLMNSPGHRFNLMLPQINEIGIGIVFGDDFYGKREMYITQLLTHGARLTDRATALRVVRQKLAALRPRMAYQPTLVPPAQQYADARAAGTPHDPAYQALRPLIDGFYGQYQNVSLVVVPTDDVEQVDLASQLGAAAGDAYGLAVADGPSRDHERATWIVMLVARRTR